MPDVAPVRLHSAALLRPQRAVERPVHQLLCVEVDRGDLVAPEPVWIRARGKERVRLLLRQVAPGFQLRLRGSADPNDGKDVSHRHAPRRERRDVEPLDRRGATHAPEKHVELGARHLAGHRPCGAIGMADAALSVSCSCARVSD